MAIEFRCTQCNRLLRTGDGAAGKQAKCPSCGLVLTVPGAAGGAAAASVPQPPPGARNAPPAAGGASPWPRATLLGPQSPGAPPLGPQSPGAPPFGSQSPGAPPFGSPAAGAAPGGPQGPSGPENPYQSPGDFRGSPSWLPAGPLAPVAATAVEVGDLFSRTWTVFKDQYGICLGLYLATVGLSFLAGIVAQVAQIMAQAAAHDAAVVVVVMIVVTLARLVFDAWVSLGLVRGMVSIARGQPTSVGVLFSAGPHLIPFILAAILLGLIILGIWLIGAVVAVPVGFLGFQGGGEDRWIAAGIGTFVLAIIPVIVVSLMFSQFQYFIIDRNADPIESLSLSRQITSGNKLTLFVGGLLAGLLLIAGMAACCVGLLFGTGPYVALLMAMFYLAMSGQTTADQLRYDAWQNPPPTMAPGISPPPLPGT